MNDNSPNNSSVEDGVGESSDNLERPRRVPALISFLHPFRLIDNEETENWQPSLEDINQNNWDYVALHKIVGGADVRLPPPFHLVVGRDGALALPPIPQLADNQTAVEFFNKCLAALLIGGMYCEAIGLDNLEIGSVIDWKFIRVNSNAPGGPNRFHNHIRLKNASALEAIALLRPRRTTMETISDAMTVGLSVLERIPTVSGEFLLKGVTGIARRDWGTALANLWIVVEQVTSYLWQIHVVSVERGKDIEGRRSQLDDSRTWTTSNRQELLFQREILDSETLRSLSVARKARNALVHQGKHPAQSAAIACYQAALKLFHIALPATTIPLALLNLDDHSITDPFKPKEGRIGEPEFWMPIPKLPGESELEQAEADARSEAPSHRV
ncbi:hypothetical protein ABIF63_000241 [Bradyrhizobium japonicum]|uniref:Apea-like HEPN domain-containing protein n=1 Tax=Bradyrhizobium japonicum TaxID=375 RepID=A0ABV2RGS8_BRAJP